MSGNRPGRTEADALDSLSQPVWTTPPAWTQANRTLGFLCRKHETGLGRAGQQARRIETALEALFPLIETLCAFTCPSCRDSCCERAKVWLNFQDLLFLHLIQGTLPLHQLRQGLKEPCRFLGDRGCTLPRISRPWICTWYLCPSQTNLLRNMPLLEQTRFQEAVREVKAGRRRMEEEFVRVVA